MPVWAPPCPTTPRSKGLVATSQFLLDFLPTPAFEKHNTFLPFLTPTLSFLVGQTAPPSVSVSDWLLELREGDSAHTVTQAMARAHGSQRLLRSAAGVSGHRVPCLLLLPGQELASNPKVASVRGNPCLLRTDRCDSTVGVMGTSFHSLTQANGLQKGKVACTQTCPAGSDETLSFSISPLGGAGAGLPRGFDNKGLLCSPWRPQSNVP